MIRTNEKCFKMILFSILFAILLALDGIIARPPPSPCPNVFAYDGEFERDRWYGVISFVSNIELSGYNIKLQMDQPSKLLVSWNGEVISKDNTVYHISDPYAIQKANQETKIRINVRFNPELGVPVIRAIAINGITVCPEETRSTPIYLDAIVEYFQPREPSTTERLDPILNQQSNANNSRPPSLNSPRPDTSPSFTKGRPSFSNTQSLNNKAPLTFLSFGNEPNSQNAGYSSNSESDILSSKPNKNHEPNEISEYELIEQESSGVRPTPHSTTMKRRPINLTTMKPTTIITEELESELVQLESEESMTPPRSTPTKRKPANLSTMKPTTSTEQQEFEPIDQEPEESMTPHSTTMKRKPVMKLTTSTEQIESEPIQQASEESMDLYSTTKKRNPVMKSTTSTNELEESSSLPVELEEAKPTIMKMTTMKRVNSTTIKPATKVTARSTTTTTTTTTTAKPTTTTTTTTMPNLPLTTMVPANYCGEGSQAVQPLAVGAQPAVPDSVPWQVAIYKKSVANRDKYDFICGGTLLTRSLILSAAHCFYDTVKKKTFSASEFKIAVGKYSIAYDQEDAPHTKIIQVKRVNIPDNYLGSETAYVSDIAILETSELITFSKKIMPICVDWTIQDSTPPSTGKVAGWGITETGNVSEVLQIANLPYMGIPECREAVKNPWFRKAISSQLDKFCAGHKIGAGVRQGDSGGGWTYKMNGRFYVYGVVSFKENDESIGTSIAAFTKVATYLDWIEEIKKRVEA